MFKLYGTPLCDGHGLGNLYFIERGFKPSAERKAYDVKDEIRKFNMALEKAVSELEEIGNRLEKDTTLSELMAAHIELIQDPDFRESVESNITDNNMSANEAVLSSGEEFASLFEAVESPEIRARAVDIRDVANRISSILSGGNEKEENGDIVLCGEEIYPSELTKQSERIRAVISKNGTATGHLAILARSLGIPLVVGTDVENLREYNGFPVIVEGKNGSIIVSPDSKAIAEYYLNIDSENKRSIELEKYKNVKCTSKNGKEIKLYCNINDTSEVLKVLQNGGDGIGLFRSEFLFMNRETPPSEDEQFLAYQQVLSQMGEKEVIIRTMDIGADKDVPYLVSQCGGNNPSLGLRGIRLCLKNKGLFKTQLRALLRASVYGNLSIMLPMISSTEEVKKAKKIITDTANELIDEGQKISTDVKLGIMIETPSSALCSEELSKEVDFFSIGTNDLTQYTLACDRLDAEVGDFYIENHPAVLRLIEMTVKNAHKNGIIVGVCGKMASDINIVADLIEMGIDELSVEPGMLLAVKEAIINDCI